ncbi:hypothetical protein IAU59_000042 [Kwoniella sp. CBS 9459]
MPLSPPSRIDTKATTGWSDDWEEEAHVEASLPSTPLDQDHPSISRWRPELGSEGDDKCPGADINVLEPRAQQHSKLESGDPVPDRILAQGQTERHETIRPAEPAHGNHETASASNSSQPDHFPRVGREKEEEEEERDVDEEGEKTCRICFTGPEEDGEEDTMGRMISPCLCTGSMRNVAHAILRSVNCLNAWRGTGTNAKAHMECPQCHYRYQLRRTLVSGLATSRLILVLSTGLTFLSITLTVGQILHLMLNKSPAIHRSLIRNYNLRWSPPSFFDVITGRDNMGFDDFNGGGGNVMIVGGGGTLAFDVFVASIKTFFELSRSFSNSQDRLSEVLSLPHPMANFILGLVIRFLLGIAVMGSMSFLSLLLSLSLFGPLQLANGLRGAGFLGNFGGVRRRIRADTTTAGAGRGPSIGTIMVVGLVVIGAINSMVQVYRGVQSLTGRLLKYVETQILEVNPHELRKERLRREKERGERARRWWIHWLREKRWMKVVGWKEVYVRARFRLMGLIEGIKRSMNRLVAGGGAGGEENEHLE